MNSQNKENKRIAKNTFYLYIRMLVSIGISLYTSRAVLDILGVGDFGVYNVVGGVVTMFTFLNNAMLTTTQRYLNFYMGKNQPQEKINTVFCTSVNIHLLISIAIFLLAETIGLWFVCNKLVIPVERYNSAIWVYQTSILSTIFMVVSSPYNALVIAHEKMDTFAIISILDVVLRLIVVLILPLFVYDQLVIYAVLLLIIQLLISFFYKIYTSIKFTEARYRFVFNKGLLKSMSSFVGWSFVGSAAYISFTQGVNIVLNLFFGPAINAARGISVQIQSVVWGFVGNIQIALNPQITKKFSSGDIGRMHQLVYANCRYSFFLLYCIALPVIAECDNILSVWLVDVPSHTVNFVRLVLIVMLVEVAANPLSVSVQATGKIKSYQIILGSIQLSILPLSYIALLFYKVPEVVYGIHFCIMIIAQFVRLVFMKKLIQMKILNFVKNVYLSITKITPPTIIIAVLIKTINNTAGCYSMCINIVLIALVSIAIIYGFGLSKSEQNYIIKFMKNGRKKIDNIISKR